MKRSFKVVKLLVIGFLLIGFQYNCKSQTGQEGYRLTGNLKGAEDDWIKMAVYDGQLRDKKPTVLDSVPLVNGAFEFKGKVDFPDMVLLKVGEKVGFVFLENREITIEADMSNAIWNFEPQVTGSKGHDTYVKMREQERAIFNDEKYAPLHELRKMGLKAKKSKVKEEMDQFLKAEKELEHLTIDRKDALKKLRYDYARNNPESPVAVHVLGYGYSEGKMSNEELEEFYKLFQGSAKETPFYKGYMTKVYKDIFENVRAGGKAPDFTLPTLQGGELTLSKVEAKYIYVDFWASWCVPCRAAFPHLKEVYAKYKKDGFDVIAVGTGDQGDKWKKAIEEDGTAWNNVFDGDPNKTVEGRVALGPVSKQYAVPFLPTTFLIEASSGTILARQLKGEKLDAKLKELYGY